MYVSCQFRLKIEIEIDKSLGKLVQVLLFFHQGTERHRQSLAADTATARGPGSSPAWSHSGDPRAALPPRPPRQPDRTPRTTGTAAPTPPSARPARSLPFSPPPTSGTTRWTSSTTIPPPPDSPRNTSSAASKRWHRRSRGRKRVLFRRLPESTPSRGRGRVLLHHIFLSSPITTRWVC